MSDGRSAGSMRIAQGYVALIAVVVCGISIAACGGSNEPSPASQATVTVTTPATTGATSVADARAHYLEIISDSNKAATSFNELVSTSPSDAALAAEGKKVSSAFREFQRQVATYNWPDQVAAPMDKAYDATTALIASLQTLQAYDTIDVSAWLSDYSTASSELSASVGRVRAALGLPQRND